MEESPLSEAERINVTRNIMTLLMDTWHLQPAQCVALLHLPADTKPRMLKRYQAGTPLPVDAEIDQRLGCFFDIQDALRTSFPFNANMSRVWLSTPNRWFNHTPPLQVMIDEGMTGIYKIRSHLDCTYNWV